MPSSKRPFFSKGSKDDSPPPPPVLPGHKKMVPPLAFPPTPYSVSMPHKRGSAPPIRSRANSIATMNPDGPPASRFSVASHHSFHRRPPSVRMPTNLTIRRSEQLAVAYVSIDDAETAAIARPILDLLDVIGDYLEGPASEEGSGRVIIGELVDVDRVLKLHTTDIEEAKKALVATRKRKKKRRILGMRKPHERPVFGAELRSVHNYAAVWMLLGRFPCKVPIVLIATVEQLYSRGMHDKNLFAPDPPQFSHKVIELMDNFSNSYNYGDETDSPINGAPIADICHLLRYFLISLPSAPLEPLAFRALTDLCVIPSAMERRKHEAAGVTLTKAEMLEDEEFRIVIAKLVLRLLPDSHIGALAYIVAFLAQLPTCSAAGFTVDRVSEMFGPMVCAPRDPLEYLELEQTFPADIDFKMDMYKLEEASVSYIESLSIDTLHWLISHWDYISVGLLQTDYESDIFEFQNLVAETIEASRVADAKESRYSNASSQTIAVEDTAEAEPIKPLIPRRITEDEESILAGEPILNADEDDDADEEDAEDGGEYDDTSDDQYPEVHRRGSDQSDATAASFSLNLTQQAQAAFESFQSSRSPMDMREDDDVKMGLVTMGLKTPLMEEPPFSYPEQRAEFDRIPTRIVLDTNPRVQHTSTQTDFNHSLSADEIFEFPRKAPLPPTTNSRPSASVHATSLDDPASGADQYRPRLESQPVTLQNEVQAKEKLIYQQASHIAGLEMKHIATESELDSMRRRAEELERREAESTAKYNALREQLENMLTTGH